MTDNPRRFLLPLIGFNLALDIIILDQISKWAVLELALRPEIAPDRAFTDLFSWLAQAPGRLPPGSLEVLPFFNLAMVWNEGISFGMFSGGTPWVLIAVSAAITLLFGIWLARTKSWVQGLSLAMVIGGAIGNLIDRVRFGAVADFLDFHAFGWHYPAFNLADSCITLGIAMLVIHGVFFDQRRKEAA